MKHGSESRQGTPPAKLARPARKDISDPIEIRPEPMEIRPARKEDLDRIMEIYAFARKFMKKTGNPTQWRNGYPDRQTLTEDLEGGHLYVCVISKEHLGQDPTDFRDRIGSEHPTVCNDGIQSEKPTVCNEWICGVFCFKHGPDPTYVPIEDGIPYHVIHRLASDGSVKGIAKACFDWCSHKVARHDDTTSGCLRADTHEDNKIMQHLLETYGFTRCGRIYVADGSPRTAYQLSC